MGMNGWWRKCALSVYNNNYVTQNICDLREFDKNICMRETKFCMRIFSSVVFSDEAFTQHKNYSCKLFLRI